MRKILSLAAVFVVAFFVFPVQTNASTGPSYTSRLYDCAVGEIDIGNCWVAASLGVGVSLDEGLPTPPPTPDHQILSRFHPCPPRSSASNFPSACLHPCSSAFTCARRSRSIPPFAKHPARKAPVRGQGRSPPQAGGQGICG
jgi:hypothetical protein